MKLTGKKRDFLPTTCRCRFRVPSEKRRFYRVQDIKVELYAVHLRWSGGLISNLLLLQGKRELGEPVTFYHRSQGEGKKMILLLLKIEKKDAHEWHRAVWACDLRLIFPTKKNMGKLTGELTRGGRGLFITGICFATLPIPERYSIPDTAPSLFIVRN